jgi:hypothetical protein
MLERKAARKIIACLEHINIERFGRGREIRAALTPVDRTMNWKPLSEEEIWDKINSEFKGMSIPQRNLWETIRMDPEKWSQNPYGCLGGGFWVVAIYGRVVVWFNDIEASI